MKFYQIQRLVTQGEYELSHKVYILVEEGLFDEADLVECVMTAPGICKKERDEKGGSVDGLKYVNIGTDTRGRPFYTVGKVARDATGKFYFYITAHAAD